MSGLIQMFHYFDKTDFRVEPKLFGQILFQTTFLCISPARR